MTTEHITSVDSGETSLTVTPIVVTSGRYRGKWFKVELWKRHNSRYTYVDPTGESHMSFPLPIGDAGVREEDRQSIDITDDQYDLIKDYMIYEEGHCMSVLRKILGQQQAIFITQKHTVLQVVSTKAGNFLAFLRKGKMSAFARFDSTGKCISEMQWDADQTGKSSEVLLDEHSDIQDDDIEALAYGKLTVARLNELLAPHGHHLKNGQLV